MTAPGEGLQRRAGAALGFAVTILSTVAGLLLTPLMIRGLGQSEFGLYQLVMSFSGYLLLLDLGLGVSVSRFLAVYRARGDEEGLRRYFSTCGLVIACVTAGVLLLGLLLWANLGRFFGSLSPAELDRAGGVFLLMLAGTAAGLLDRFLTGAAGAFERFVFVNGAKLIKLLLRTGLLIALLWPGGSAASLAAADMVLNLLFAAATLLYCSLRLRLPLFSRRYDGAMLRESVGYSVFIFLQALVNQVNTNADKLILGVMSDTLAVSVYAVAMQFYMVYGGIAWVIPGVYLPRVATLAEQGRDGELTGLVISTGRLQFMGLGAILGGFLLFGREFIELWAGEGFEGTWGVAALLMAAATLPLTQSMMENVLAAKNRMAFRSVLNLVTAGVNLGLSVLLTRLIGMFGPAVSTAFVLTAGNTVILNAYYHRKIGISPFKVFGGILRGVLPCLLAACLGGYLLTRLPGSSWGLFCLRTGGFLLVYGALLLRFGMSDAEKALIKAWAGRNSHRMLGGIAMRHVNPEAEGCVGCGACRDVCGQGAIRMAHNGEGFLVPAIDEEKCIGCGACLRVCPALHPPAENKPLRCCFGFHLDDDIRRSSSSGGVFAGLASAVLEQGGEVFGAIFDSETGRVVYAGTDEQPVAALQKSKYAESDTGEVFVRIRGHLAAGRKVLFCGTPCHVHGLLRYLGGPRAGLFTCDLICHGVPSGGLFAEWLGELSRRQGAEVRHVDFRPKSQGWSKHRLRVHFENGRMLERPYWQDPYYLGFSDNLTLRKSCYDCRYTSSHAADLTLGDFWGVRSYMPFLNDERGLSLVFVNTSEGEQLLAGARGLRLLGINWRHARYALKGREGAEYDRKRRDRVMKRSWPGILWRLRLHQAGWVLRRAIGKIGGAISWINRKRP